MIPGPKVILLGESGTGKTYATRTLLDAGITPFFIFTEPGQEVIADLLDKVHYAYVPMGTGNWDSMLKTAQMVNTLDFNGVAKMVDSGRRNYDGFLKVISLCNNFVDQNGKEFGDVMSWGTDRALIIDSLSGLNELASQMVVGGKPVKAMQDWQVAQNMIKNLLNQLTSSVNATFVLCAHVSREKDELTGAMHLTVNTLGKALAPEVPRYFSDVINTVRKGKEFSWDTAGTNIVCKTRNLPIESGLKPSFVPLIETWKKRGGKIAEQKSAA